MLDRRIEELLPWYANGTLAQDEKDLVEDALSNSETLREELSILNMMREQVQQEQAPEVSELGWRRLQKQIKTEEPAKARFEWFKPATAVAAVFIVALQVGILTNQDTAMDTELLSGSAVILNSPHWIVQLEFKDDASWQQVHELLTSSGAQLVEGPSTLGLVRIAVPEDSVQFGSAEELVLWFKGQGLVSHAALQE